MGLQRTTHRYESGERLDGLEPWGFAKMKKRCLSEEKHRNLPPRTQMPSIVSIPYLAQPQDLDSDCYFRCQLAKLCGAAGDIVRCSNAVSQHVTIPPVSIFIWFQFVLQEESTAIREKLADLYQEEENWKQCAMTLIGIPLDSGSRCGRARLLDRNLGYWYHYRRKGSFRVKVGPPSTGKDCSPVR